MQALIQTRADLDTLGADERRGFLQWLKGTATIRVNAADYPEDYDQSLQPGEDGYVAPDWRDQVDMRSLQSFGFESTEELESELAAQN